MWGVVGWVKPAGSHREGGPAKAEPPPPLGADVGFAPAIYERDHRRPYSAQPQHPNRDYIEPQIPDRLPTYSNPGLLPPRHLEPPIPEYQPTYLNQQPLPPTPITYSEPEYEPFPLEDGYSEEEVDGGYPPLNDGRQG